MSVSLPKKFDPQVVPILEKAIMKEASKVKSQIKKAAGGRDTTLVIQSRLAELTQINDTDIFDMTDIDLSSMAWSDPMTLEKQNEYTHHMTNINRDESHSRSILVEMVVKGQTYNTIM